jgi:thioredoxin reductase (NADPH)
MEKIYDMLIVGGGPGGYTAALYATRAGLSTLVLEKLSAGGQMALTAEIDNYPGFPEGVDGFQLGMDMQAGAERFGAETRMAEVTKLELDAPVKLVHTSEGIFRGRTVVLSTGANPRKLGLPMEDALTGKGLHYCAHCDGMFYRNKTVMVVGGGNSAVADALLLSRICKKVILVHRRDTLRATRLYHAQLEKAENVEFRWNSTVTQLLHGDRLNGVKLKNVVTGEETEEYFDGLFVSIGRDPASHLVAGLLALDDQGYVLADESTRTSLPGVFAVGDVRTKALRQIVTAVADGAVAAHYAEMALSEENI